MRANPVINQSLMKTLMEWIRDGKLKPAPVQSRPMSDYQHGLIDQLAGRIVGKLVLTNA
jgi:NADPH:quinone reductase-like Zn-dependent oxidoreductase